MPFPRLTTGGAIAVIGLMLSSAQAMAQDPRQIPGMVITGVAGKGALRGFVRDDSGVPQPGAEVYIPELQRRTSTRDDGSYRFDSLPKGSHEVYARKMNYRAQVKKVRLGDQGSSLDFDLRYAPRALPAIVSRASRGGLSGVVADTAFRVLDSVLVRVAGEGMTAYTDSAGGFYFPLRGGHYLVSLFRKGYGTKVVSVTIPDDSGRRIQAFMQPTRVESSIWILTEQTQRLALRNLTTSRVYTREDLEKLHIEWVYQAVVMTTAHFNYREVPSRRCEAIVDGMWKIEVGRLLTDDIDSIELYHAGGRSQCPTIYAWMR